MLTGLTRHDRVARAPSTSVAVFPIPGDKVADPSTQLTFRGLPTSPARHDHRDRIKSGVHAGTLEADSDGEGGSFLPAKPFTAGETVTVKTALNIVGGHGGHLQLHGPDAGQPGAPRARCRRRRRPRARCANFVSRPDLKPAALTVDKLPTKAAAPGDLFIAPQAGPVRNGAELLGPYGGLLWFYPAPKGTYVTDFREQTYQGKPVLTWWQGNVNVSGVGHGEDEIYNTSYQPRGDRQGGQRARLRSARVPAHPAGHRVRHGLSAGDGGRVEHQARLQARDRVRRRRPGDRHQDRAGPLPVEQPGPRRAGPQLLAGRPAKTGVPWDYFHVNSIQPQSDGSLVISSRNTSAIYKISGQTGAIQWTLGGKDPSFKMGKNTMFYFQHDARIQADGDAHAVRRRRSCRSWRSSPGR